MTAHQPSLHGSAQALLDRKLPRPLRSILYPLGAMLVTALAWASLTEVDRIVVVNGRMVTAERPMVVQPFERGVVRSIEVAVGQRVERGEVLATLDPTLAETAERELANRRERLLAAVARLGAEIDGRAYMAATRHEAELLEARLSAQRIAELEARRGAFVAAERRLQAKQDSLAHLLRTLGARLDIARDVEAMRQELRLREAGPRLALLQAQSERLLLEEQIANARAEQEDQRRQVEALRAERAVFEQGWHKDTAERLIEARRDLETLTQQLAAAQRRREWVVLRAPSDGIVLEVARRSVGSVVQEAETLITLVPAHTALETEVEIGPADIGHVQPGATARLKLQALSFQRHGMLSGVVRLVDADALPSGVQGAGGRSAHRARIEITDAQLRGAPAGFRLMPGMEVSAEVNVGRRSVISYFLEPILRVGDESLREK